MNKSDINVIGDPICSEGQYIFYAGFEYYHHNLKHKLCLNSFFFVKVSKQDDPCIGELNLVWKDKQADCLLASIRLYFLPEQTPDGRLATHGQHEVLAASEKVIIRLVDLVTWITDEVDWMTGLEMPINSRGLITKPPSFSSSFLNILEPSKIKDWNKTRNVFLNSGVPLSDVQKNGKKDELIEPLVMVISFPQYCRYRAMLKKMEMMDNLLTNKENSLASLHSKSSSNHFNSRKEGYHNSNHTIRILFCRDTFENEGLLHHDLNCEHLAPKLKGRPRKRNNKNHFQRSSSQESDTSVESKVKPTRRNSLKSKNNGINKSALTRNNSEKTHLSPKLVEKCLKNEQEFIKQLYKFMKERKTPIQRIPHLGFKKIDLYYLFTYSQRLGGYDKITFNKKWKKVYDELGGDPRSTSAATCTRRHFERLLLPFEKYLNSLRGVDYSDDSTNNNTTSTNNSNKRSHSSSTHKSTQGPKKRGRKPKRFKISNDEESSGSVSSHSNNNDDKMIKETSVNKKFETSKKMGLSKENERLKTRSEVTNRVNSIEDDDLNSVKSKLKPKASDAKLKSGLADYKLNDMKLIVKISRLSNNALQVKQDSNNAYHDDTDLEDNNEDGDKEEVSLKNIKSEETKDEEMEVPEQSKADKPRCDNLKGSTKSSIMGAMSPLSSISTLIASMKTKKSNHSVNSPQPTSTPSPAPSEKSSRPSVIQKTGSRLKPCVKVVPTYKVHSICNSSGGSIISNLNNKMINPPEAHKSSISKQNIRAACLESRPLDLCIRSNSISESPKDSIFSFSLETEKNLSSEQQLSNHPPILDLSAKSSKISANTVAGYSSVQKVPKINKEASFTSQTKTHSCSSLSQKQICSQPQTQPPPPPPPTPPRPPPPSRPPAPPIQQPALLSPNSVNSKLTTLTRKLPEATSKPVSNCLENSLSSGLRSTQRNTLIGNRPLRNPLDFFYHTPISQPLVSLNPPKSNVGETEPIKHNLIKDHNVSKASINLSTSNQSSNQHFFNHNRNHFQNIPAISEYNPTLPFFHLPFASPLATPPAIGALYQQATNGAPFPGFNENLMNIYSSMSEAPLNSLPYKHLFEPKIERSRKYSYFPTE